MRRLVIALALGWTSIYACEPTGVTVQNFTNGRRLTSALPTWRWTSCGSQTNWQIQVDGRWSFDRDGTYGGGGDTQGNQAGQVKPYQWDSGIGSKSGQEAATQATMGTPSVNSNGTRPLDTRAGPLYWRMRTENSGVWGNWVYGLVSRNHLPHQPQGVRVDQAASGGAVAWTTYPGTDPNAATYYVATNGSNAHTCAQARDPNALTDPNNWAKLTIQAGVNCRDSSGDDVKIHDGTYVEAVTVGTANSGTAGDWFEISAVNSRQVIWKNNGGSPALQTQINWLKVSGIVWADTSTASAAVRILSDSGSRGRWLWFTDWSVDSTHSSSKPVFFIQNAGGSDPAAEHLIFTNFQIAASTPFFDIFDVENCRNCRWSNFTINGSFGTHHTGIQFHGSDGVYGSSGSVVSDGVFKGGTYTTAPLSYYLSSGGSIARNLVFDGITLGSSGIGCIDLLRTPGLHRVENCLFMGCTVGAGIFQDEFSEGLQVINSIFINNTRGLRFTGSNGGDLYHSSLDSFIRHSTFCNNSTADITDPNNAVWPEYAARSYGNYIRGDGLSCTNSGGWTTDPLVNTSTYAPDPNSSSINTGDPDILKPVGGGSLSDRGPREVGASGPPYTYQPQFRIANGIAKLSWTYNDWDNRLVAFRPKWYRDAGGLDRQVAFWVEMDTSCDFDSTNGHALYSTGAATFATSGRVAEDPPSYEFTVPSALPSGTYCARVASYDNTENTFVGAFSPPVVFEVP